MVKNQRRMVMRYGGHRISPDSRANFHGHILCYDSSEAARCVLGPTMAQGTAVID
jgi:hypothetical protein